MDHQFETPRPVRLYVEVGRGNVHVTAADVTTTTVEVSGRGADETIVTQDGDQISVIAPRHRTGFFGGQQPEVDVRLVAPRGSELVSTTGSADLMAKGELSLAKVKAGSGDVNIEQVTGPAVVDSGSGDILLGRLSGEVRIKSGSGDVRVRLAEATLGISTGSGDIAVEESRAASVLKTGSGDQRIDRAQADVSLTSGSGDLTVGLLERGSVQAKNASGDIGIGIPSGIPVWTDVSSITGSISSSLEGAGQPAPGEDHLELRATTVSGDITLKQL